MEEKKENITSENSAAVEKDNKNSSTEEIKSVTEKTDDVKRKSDSETDNEDAVKKDTAAESGRSGDKEKSTDVDLDDELDEDDEKAGDLILENIRESIPLTPENARFIRSAGNLISLELTVPGKEPEFFERVMLLRAFPLTNPTEFISVKEPDSKELGNGKEIGMIRYMSDFDEETTMLFLEELDRRYFAPEITKINSCREKFGYSYWNVETSAGNVTFVLNNPFSNIRLLEDGCVLINDIDGNAFEIHDPSKLDTASYRKIEIYL